MRSNISEFETDKEFVDAVSHNLSIYLEVTDDYFSEELNMTK